MNAGKSKLIVFGEGGLWCFEKKVIQGRFKVTGSIRVIRNTKSLSMECEKLLYKSML